MKIIFSAADTDTIFGFAEKHNLTLRISERTDSGLPKYFVSFEGVGISDDHFVVSVFGNGNTIFSAIADYSKLVSRKKIQIINNGKSLEVYVPYLLI